MMHPMGMGSCSGNVSLLLIACAAGYAVLALSNRQERPLNTLGRIVGGLILVVSFVGLLCVAASRWCRKPCKTDSFACPISKMMAKESPVVSAPVDQKPQ